jgi:hypothetical protein
VAIFPEPINPQRREDAGWSVLPDAALLERSVLMIVSGLAIQSFSPRSLTRNASGCFDLQEDSAGGSRSQLDKRNVHSSSVI